MVDGDLTSPVPVQAARTMGADFDIAVDVSNVARRNKLTGTVDVLQTFAIMGFAGRHRTILEGERAASIMPELKAKLAKARAR
ncbi:hypothetical protein [Thiobacillus denitrificans]|uniref:hypothetical protein n=1 Tax=Thiobacillus denitrificans TaxID=36861 RepID=UPI00075E8699|nr:hypothetical protein [Thiobacillus denitrificans]